ncbi:DUF4367 domain-containing protein [Alteromonas sp. 345S023]|uniref:DUF4367 domain-containing protein n=2 Tax=Alteromonas profundi TaxID=2696062 RepID=A0A7X5LNE3_9ALTE|nr:DUF4367 domain-containing protein [Alteromonas profundi]
MNMSQIKAFMGDQKVDQKASVHPNEAIKKQLQSDGLQQAAEFSKQQAATVTMSSSQTSIGLKVFSGSLSQNVVVDGKRPQESTAASETEDKKEASLFDFEEVAKNVLRFVGGVIKGAADSGAPDDKLSGLVAQAREGVSKGFAMAEKELASFMNDEIAEGMDKSRDLIDTGINKLQADIFGKNTPIGASELSVLSASDERTGHLHIKTKDGDEVTLRFDTVRQMSLTEQSDGSQVNTDTQNENNQTYPSQTSIYQFYEKTGISFSLQGELDEDELEAIANVVGQAQDLADTFYSGDLDTAFEQALDLGFDDKELVGYALQLNRTTQAEVMKTYENIKHYSEDAEVENQYGNVVSPVSQYVEKMMATLENAQNTLASSSDYNTLISGLINEMKDVQVPDLVSAINRFHSFNRRLLDNMPQQEGSEV